MPMVRQVVVVGLVYRYGGACLDARSGGETVTIVEGGKVIHKGHTAVIVQHGKVVHAKPRRLFLDLTWPETFALVIAELVLAAFLVIAWRTWAG